MLFGIVSSSEHIDIDKLKALLKEDKGSKDDVDKQFIVKHGLQSAKGKEKVKNDKGA
jgi:7-keto-8-aminopelargonate synthetase-like enzyme